MKKLFSAFVLVSSLLCMVSLDLTCQSSPDVGLVGTAEAIVGAPLTPVSAAGVARRTTRRVVATEATVATTAAASSQQQQATAQQQAATAQQQAATAQQQQAIAQQQAAVAQQQASPVPVGTVIPKLPGGCTSITVQGVNYSDCGGAFYKAAFQGNNLVYVVVEKPFK